jgi:hypothetical protein
LILSKFYSIEAILSLCEDWRYHVTRLHHLMLQSPDPPVSSAILKKHYNDLVIASVSLLSFLEFNLAMLLVVAAKSRVVASAEVSRSGGPVILNPNRYSYDVA